MDEAGIARSQFSIAKSIAAAVCDGVQRAPFHRRSFAPVWRAGRVQPQLALWAITDKVEAN
jgi:hypothetical protein